MHCIIWLMTFITRQPETVYAFVKWMIDEKEGRITSNKICVNVSSSLHYCCQFIHHLITKYWCATIQRKSWAKRDKNAAVLFVIWEHRIVYCINKNEWRMTQRDARWMGKLYSSDTFKAFQQSLSALLHIFHLLYVYCIYSCITLEI